MDTVLTHLDADGVICLSLFFMKFPDSKPRVYFTSPIQLRDTICTSVRHRRELGNLYIFDIANENRAIYAAAMYDKVLWIDHHRWDPEISFPHVEVVVDSSARSAADVVAKYFSLETPLVSIANEIDTNSVRTEEAEKLRTVIGALRWKYSGRELTSRLYKLARELTSGDLSFLDSYGCVEEYKEWLREVGNRAVESLSVYRSAGLKIAVVETIESMPVYMLTNLLEEHEEAPFDIILVILRKVVKGKAVTKMEFRTQTDINVLKLAKMFGGGGHVKASGATVDGIITVPEILRAVEMLYS